VYILSWIWGYSEKWALLPPLHLLDERRDMSIRAKTGQVDFSILTLPSCVGPRTAS
jgi:hypothetical protein